MVIYTRNSLGQITAVQTKDSPTDPLVNVVSSVTYNPFGPIASLTFGNGVVTTLTYDKDYRASRIATTASPQEDVIYSFDPAGNITNIADQIGSNSRTYTYDALDRLATDNNPTGQWTYQYDANGNRTQRTWTHPDTTVTSLNPSYATTSNRMTQLNTAAVTQDGAGNTTAVGSATSYTYNHANRLNVATLSGASAGLRYNALGQRVQLQGAKTKHYTYADDHRYLMVKRNNGDGSSDIRYEYIWLDDLPIAQVFGTYQSGGGVTLKTTYIHADHLNTPRTMTSSTGVTVWRWQTDGFGYSGPLTDPDGNGTHDYLNLRFPGQIYDSETGFSYNVFRDYDPSTGRYLQSDPIGLGDGLNTYSYVGSSPNMARDPLGLFRGIPAQTSAGIRHGNIPLPGGDCIICSSNAFYPRLGEPTEPSSNNVIPFPKKRPTQSCPKPDENDDEEDACEEWLNDLLEMALAIRLKLVAINDLDKKALNNSIRTFKNSCPHLANQISYLP